MERKGGNGKGEGEVWVGIVRMRITGMRRIRNKGMYFVCITDYILLSILKYISISIS